MPAILQQTKVQQVRRLVQSSQTRLWLDGTFSNFLIQVGKNHFWEEPATFARFLFSTFPLYKNSRVMDSTGGLDSLPRPLVTPGQGCTFVPLAVCVSVLLIILRTESTEGSSGHFGPSSRLRKSCVRAVNPDSTRKDSKANHSTLPSVCSLHFHYHCIFSSANSWIHKCSWFEPRSESRSWLIDRQPRFPTPDSGLLWLKVRLTQKLEISLHCCKALQKRVWITETDDNTFWSML